MKNLWTQGSLRKSTRLSAGQVSIISKSLVGLQKFTPREFARKPRSMDQLKFFKATEFRQILLYSGPVVFKSVLPKNLYQHFLYLHVAIRILVSNQAHEEKYIAYAHTLLVLFVEEWKVLYGMASVTYNVHSLVHLANDVRKYGPLDLFSAFKFENYLGELKQKIRSPAKPLQQIINRLHELTNICTKNNTTILEEYSLKRQYFTGCTIMGLDGEHFHELHLKNNIVITDNTPDNCVLMKNNEIILVAAIITIQSGSSRSIKLLGHKFRKEDFFDNPCKSAMQSIYIVSHLSRHIQYWNVSDIKWKCTCYPRKNAFVVLPIIHNISRMHT